MSEYTGTIRNLIRPYCLATVRLTPEDLDKDLETKYGIESDIKSKPQELEKCHKTVMKEIGVKEGVGISTSKYYSTLRFLLRSGKIDIQSFISKKAFEKLKIDKAGEEMAINYLAWCIIKLYGDWSKSEPRMPA